MNENTQTIFLDVDGVINSLNHLYQGSNGLDFNAEVRAHQANGFTIYVPDYMSDLLRSLNQTCEIKWLTTWRDRANQWISPILGLPTNLDVLTDGTDERHVGWKTAVAERASDYIDGPICWIEDFGPGHAPDISWTITHGVDACNTDDRSEGVLLPQHLEDFGLLEVAVQNGYQGPLHINRPSKASTLLV